MTSFLQHLYYLSLMYTIIIAVIVMADPEIREGMAADTVKEYLSFLIMCFIPIINLIVIAIFVYTVMTIDKSKGGDANADSSGS